MSFLHNLYRGKFNMNEYETPDTEEFKEAVKASVRTSRAFEKMLTEEQKVLYDEYNAARAHLDDLEQEDYFCRGFRLAVQMMNEIRELESK
jgi:hypothetical protein